MHLHQCGRLLSPKGGKLERTGGEESRHQVDYSKGFGRLVSGVVYAVCVLSRILSSHGTRGLHALFLNTGETNCRCCDVHPIPAVALNSLLYLSLSK